MSERGAPDEDFLTRWSRRKLAEERPEPLGPVAADGQAEPESAPVLTDADMPPLETLDEQSDYSGFLSPGVSEQLRRMALRKLFHLPAFRVTDGLNDYDDDYRAFVPLGEIVTADMRFHAERLLRASMEAESESVAEASPPAGAAKAPESVADADDEPVEG